jgi:hypothetical protein
VLGLGKRVVIDQETVDIVLLLLRLFKVDRLCC